MILKIRELTALASECVWQFAQESYGGIGGYGIFFFGIHEANRDFHYMRPKLLHFTAGKSYEKYVKLLIGMMILAQFVVPVRALFLSGENAELWEEVERFQSELEEMTGDIEWEYPEENGTAAAFGEEVKEKLGGIAGEYGFYIKGVTVYEEPPKVEVTVGKTQGGGKIQIEKIEVISGEDIGQRLAGADTGNDKMRQDFAAALCTDEKYIVINE